MFTVIIDKLKVRTFIGVNLNERKKKQILHVSIKFSYNIKKKSNIDNINNLISYSEVIKFIKHYIESSRFKTLEKLIMESKNELNKNFQIKNLSVRISKPIIAKKLESNSISVTK